MELTIQSKYLGNILHRKSLFVHSINMTILGQMVSPMSETLI